MNVAIRWPAAMVPRGFDALRDRQPLWWHTAQAFALLTIVCVLLGQLDDRTLNGVSVWMKPFKFSLSLAVYFATLAWFAPLLPDGYLTSRRGRWLTRVAVVCAAFEIAYIVLQASRGEASHFNVTTPFHSAMYSLMGGGAAILVSVCAWLGAVILRRHRTSDPYAFAVGIGLLLTFALGGGFGGYLGGHMSHWVGGTASDAHGVWLFKWSSDGGDLRVAHFFGMHAMQVLPLLAAALPRTLPRRIGIAWVGCAAMVYAAGTTFTFVQALRGVPFVGSG